ncbi:hypothetical protein HanRHA438_Chr08g0353511 [Helianthus annuus]|uniref:Uncharacterized protein n=1 Tax=Helianthus annuus TaxID=4232 RepID=A0A9K3IFJ2_HELAN|nr:hypothetical protein HanXRQr2_Chr08g0342171 [Helianthus annuus]KAJ0539114.1 hypothetical protein HanHA300_Chr08g0282661 [Helianthus annuus]KAJ0547188.1 hypothetical protein HanIR_Chr08g0369351 [Helianthus annuus]KAJ0553761.1 hypothetical protein HanHA89_Chr08g0300021 [Helianthus annuus]KAJ0719420.1 hypothetical protein HanLR1_Chr08g0281551 [Helianthus annuus]
MENMHEIPTRAFTFPEGVLAMGGLAPFTQSGQKLSLERKMTLWDLLHGDCRDVKFMLGDKVEPSMSRGLEKKVPKSSIQAGDSAVKGKDEEGSSNGKEDSQGSLRMKSSSNNEYDEDLETRLIRKRKAARPVALSGQKTFPAVKATSELPPVGAKGSLSKHLRSSSLISEPLLGSSKALIEVPTAHFSSRVRDKTPEISAARITPAFDVSPLHATGTSKPSHPEGLVSQSPLPPLFADALPVPYVPKWKITPSTVVGTPETARDFLAYVVPPSHKFMNSVLRSDLFDYQYSMSLCEGFFRGAGMLQRMDELRRENEGLKADLKTSQTVAAELRCRVTDAERKLLEETGAGAMLEQRGHVWERERMAWAEEKEELVAELKRQKELDSVSQGDLDTMYAEWGIAMDDNQKLAKERYWLITKGFGSFLTAVSQSEEFTGLTEMWVTNRV